MIFAGIVFGLWYNVGLLRVPGSKVPGLLNLSYVITTVRLLNFDFLITL